MIALTFAAALLFGATPAQLMPAQPLLGQSMPAQPVSFTASQPAPASFQPASDGPVLSAVAVTLECTAHADGHVGACSVLGETHPGLGFGDAAIALMKGETVAPSAHDFQFAKTIQFMP